MILLLRMMQHRKIHWLPFSFLICDSLPVPVYEGNEGGYVSVHYSNDDGGLDNQKIMRGYDLTHNSFLIHSKASLDLDMHTKR